MSLALGDLCVQELYDVTGAPHRRGHSGQSAGEGHSLPQAVVKFASFGCLVRVLLELVLETHDNGSNASAG